MRWSSLRRTPALEEHVEALPLPYSITMKSTSSDSDKMSGCTAQLLDTGTTQLWRRLSVPLDVGTARLLRTRTVLSDCRFGCIF
jgi:hypothetical protein